ncbi:MAG: pyrroline-5-carboxylate reductase [Geobacteraceae bacterium]|nr:pyrroline-5-carboxylate reductase [Geobacteraceae bacterium]
MFKNITLGFIGGGNMAEAIIKGMIAGGTTAETILVSEPVEARRSFLEATYGVSTTGSNEEVVRSSETVILAIKPQQAATVCTPLKNELSEKHLLVSIMAGVSCAAIEGFFTNSPRVIRVMPNTPSLVLAGAAAAAAGSLATSEDMAKVEGIFSKVGCCYRIEEKLMDAVTALSGSGPAYVLTFIEALADGGVKNGLPRDTALNLALQTVLGTARLLAETGEHPGSLRDKVTSPGGTTIAGLHALEKGAFRATVMNAVDAAAARSKELGK